MPRSYSLYRVTDRLGHLTADKNLWKMVDFRPHKLTSSELLKYVNYFKKSTKYLAMRGFRSEAPDPQWMEEVLTPELMKEICSRCPELETLILHEHFGVAFKVGFFCKHENEVHNYSIIECDILLLVVHLSCLLGQNTGILHLYLMTQVDGMFCHRRFLGMAQTDVSVMLFNLCLNNVTTYERCCIKMIITGAYYK